MPLVAHGVQFDAPAGFEVDEVTISLRAPEPAREARVLNKQTAVRPNLVVRRQKLEQPTDLAALALKLIAEVLQEVPDLQAPTKERFEFADGAVGLLLGFDYPLAGDGVCLRQYQAIRLDESTLTNVLLTVDKNTLTPALDADYKKHIRSIAVVGVIEEVLSCAK
jgi:hypothetical protein